MSYLKFVLISVFLEIKIPEKEADEILKLASHNGKSDSTKGTQAVVSGINLFFYIIALPITGEWIDLS